jgi:hypothetical protein
MSAIMSDPSQPKCSCASSGGLGDDWHLQSPTDSLSDLSNWHALFGDRVIPSSHNSLLQHQSIEPGSIKLMHRRQTVESVADIR